jgi:putative flippase GtrA
MNLTIRLLKFGAVGASCLALQYVFLLFFAAVVHLYFAEAFAFLLSAQLNFALNQIFTWSDRKTVASPLIRWAKFNACALASALIVNASTFWALVECGVWTWVSMLLATCASTAFNFAMCSLVVFKPDRAASGSDAVLPNETLAPPSATLLGPATP